MNDSNPVARAILQAIATGEPVKLTPEECAEVYADLARYEYLRRTHVTKFAQIFKDALRGRFDDVVDNEIIAEKRISESSQ